MSEAAGSLSPLQRQPSNHGSAEQFPDFCLHHDDIDSATTANSPTTPTASSPVSSRSCSLSSICTTPSSRLSVCSSLDLDCSLKHWQLQELDPWTAVAPESSSSPGSSSAFAASPTPSRSRRDKKALQAARQQRSGSALRKGAVLPLSTGQHRSPSSSTQARRFQRTASTPADALAALEPPHDQGLARMAFAEQQRWITVQQKTFTKWLNTKIEARDLVVKDLVADLSDGVGNPLRCLSEED